MRPDFDLPEGDCRRDEFAEESEPVVLSDGQAWFFPKPWIALRPIVQGDNVTGHVACLTVGPKLDALIEAIHDAESFTTKIQAIQILGIYLLRRNYLLSDEEIEPLFTYRQGDPVCLDWAQSIVQVATGADSPKQSGGGGC